MAGEEFGFDPATMVAELLEAETVGELVALAWDFGLHDLMNVQVAAWPGGAEIDPAAVAAVRMASLVAHEKHLGTVLTARGTQAVLTKSLGREKARAVVRSLAEWLIREGGLGGLRDEPAPPEATPPTPPSDLPPAPKKGPALAQWAADHGGAHLLAANSWGLCSTVLGLSKHLQRRPHLSNVDALLRTPGLPDNLMASLRAWLVQRVTEHSEAAARHGAFLGRLRAPGTPALDAVHRGLLGEGERLSKGEALRLPHEMGRLRLTLDPAGPALHVHETLVHWGSHQTLIDFAAGGVAVVCSCGDTRTTCAKAATGVIEALRLLSDPQAPPSELADQLRRELERPAWERLVDDLDGVLAEAARARSEQSGPVLEPFEVGWRVRESGGGYTVNPVECRPKVKGGGLKTRVIKFADVWRQLDACVHPADRRILTLLMPAPEAVDPEMRSRCYFERPVGHVVLEALVGHPRVFGERNRPIAVRREPLALACSTTPSGALHFELKLGPQVLGHDDLEQLQRLRTVSGSAVLEMGGSGDFVLFRLERQVQALAGLMLRRGAIVEREGAEAFLTRVPALAPAVELALDPSLRGDAVPADPRPHVKVDVLPEGAVRVTARVRPLEEAGEVIPGEGPVEVFAVRGGRRVHAPRDLGDELRRVKGLGLPEEAIGPEGILVLDIDEALDLVSRLAEAGDAAVVEWGVRRPRVVRGKSVANLQLSVRPMKHWFKVEGGLQVDDAFVSLEDVRRALDARRRYVRVAGDVWVRLGDELAGALGPALDAMHAGRHGLEVGTGVTPALEALAEAGAEVELPPEWALRTERMREAAVFEAARPAGLVADLREYQLAGFRWMARLARWADGACLADDMGLGKTLQALALLLHRQGEGPALVVAPTSVGFNWLREAGRFAPGLRVRAYRGAQREAMLEGLSGADVLVTSYDLLTRDAKALQGVEWGTAVLDEAQAIKNADTLRAKAAFALNARFRLALTGTPVENRTTELWSLFRFVAPGLLGSQESFMDRWAVPIDRDGNGELRMRLGRLVRPFILRRIKSEVARELPARTELIVEVELSAAERKLYEEVRKAAITALEDESLEMSAQEARFKALAAITKLRQLACHPRLVDPRSTVKSSKLERVVELLSELKAEGHRALVFSQFTGHLALVREALEAQAFELRYLDGSTPEARRREEVDAFQAGRGDAFLISLKAGGTGLNLTGATYVLHLDPWWNPAVEDQATDRAHRIGQSQAVTVFRIVARGTLEESILALHADKRDLAAALLDGTGATAALSPEQLMTLITSGGEVEVTEDEGPVVEGEAAMAVAVEAPAKKARGRKAKGAEAAAPAEGPETATAAAAAAAIEAPPASASGAWEPSALDAAYERFLAESGMSAPAQRQYLRHWRQVLAALESARLTRVTVDDVNATAERLAQAMESGRVMAPATAPQFVRVAVRKMRALFDVG